MSPCANLNTYSSVSGDGSGF